jgi:small conductance mechanosensitive channel
MIERLIAWLPSLFAALVVLFLFWILQRVLDGVLRRLMGRTRADPAAQEIAGRLMRYVVLGFGVVTAAAQLGFDVGSLLAGLGILGLALGLAAQDSLANLVAGLTILWDRPFRIGDNVTVSGTFGKVQEIGLRTTRIRTVDQLDAMLPNKEIINQKIVNHTLSPMMRLDIPLGIAYKEDSREARKVLLAAVAGNELLLEKPEPEVVVVALADSSVNLELRVWLRDPYKERQATVEMIERAKIALDEAGIEIPFPQRTLHLPSGVRLARSDDERDG